MNILARIENESSENDLATGLKEVFAKLKPKEKQLIVIGGFIPGSICFELRMPRMGIADLSNAIQYEVSRYAPFEAERLVIGFRVIPDEPGEQKNYHRVRVFAVTHERWEELLEDFDIAGIKADLLVHPMMAFDPLLKDMDELFIPEIYPDFSFQIDSEDHFRRMVWCVDSIGEEIPSSAEDSEKMEGQDTQSNGDKLSTDNQNDLGENSENAEKIDPDSISTKGIDSDSFKSNVDPIDSENDVTVLDDSICSENKNEEREREEELHKETSDKTIIDHLNLDFSNIDSDELPSSWDSYSTGLVLASYAVGGEIQKDQLSLTGLPKKMIPERFRGLRVVFIIMAMIACGFLLSYAGRIWWEDKERYEALQGEIASVKRDIHQTQLKNKRSKALNDVIDQIAEAEMGSDVVPHCLYFITEALPTNGFWLRSYQIRNLATDLNMIVSSDMKSDKSYQNKLRKHFVLDDIHETTSQRDHGQSVRMSLNYKQKIPKRVRDDGE